jgi:hypothetical protein
VDILRHRIQVAYHLLDSELGRRHSGANFRTLSGPAFQRTKALCLTLPRSAILSPSQSMRRRPVFTISYTSKEHSTRGTINGINAGFVASTSELLGRFDLGNFDFAAASYYSFL